MPATIITRYAERASPVVVPTTVAFRTSTHRTARRASSYLAAKCPSSSSATTVRIANSASVAYPPAVAYARLTIFEPARRARRGLRDGSSRLARAAGPLRAVLQHVHERRGGEDEEGDRGEGDARDRRLVDQPDDQAAHAVADALEEDEDRAAKPLLHLGHPVCDAGGELLRPRALVPRHVLPQHRLEEGALVARNLRLAGVLADGVGEGATHEESRADVDEGEQHFCDRGAGVPRPGQRRAETKLVEGIAKRKQHQRHRGASPESREGCNHEEALLDGRSELQELGQRCGRHRRRFGLLLLGRFGRNRRITCNRRAPKVLAAAH
mmetsp:Transcript_17330/g.50292  ORF Transcript_17330/g.50292 Transcript_17330/m.50292 type:complete len:325 (+) Transcript_17330:592-1566(+)